MRSYIHPYNKIAFGFVWLAVIAAGLVIYFVVLKAQINITPTPQRHTTTFLLAVSNQNESDDGAIAGKIQEATKEAEQTFASQGETEVAVSGDFLGTVTLINELGFDQPLIATTRLLTPNNILLRLKTAVTVPANSEIEAVVYADDENFAAEISPAKLTIPGLSVARQKVIYGEIKNTLGNKEKVAMIRQADIDNAREILAEKLYKEATEELKEERDNDINFNFVGRVPRLKTVTLEEVISEETDAKAEDVAPEFKIKVKVRVANITFDENKILDSARRKLTESLPDDKQLLNIEERNFTYVVENYDANKELANVKVYAQGQMILSPLAPIIDPELFARKTITETKEYLESLPSVDKTEITLPLGQKRLPKKANKIKINILKEEL